MRRCVFFSVAPSTHVYHPCNPGGDGCQKDVIVTNSGRLSARFSSTLIVALMAASLQAQEKPDLASLSVDDLMNVEVTSVSKRGEKLSDTAAAVFVISQDDIRRSGATSIPEMLRMVPGLDVARVNGSVWAISARGSNGQFANKLLVMIDGRSVYTPLFSGVFWDTQDTLLEDIDRIEVIRGPGGTLWGANAVNGIINIITKHAIETQGTLVSAGGGAEAGTSASARYGGSFGHNGYYRAYGKSFDRPASVGGVNLTEDAWALGRAGFRADWTSRRGDNFTAQGDLYRGSESTLGKFDPIQPFANLATLNHVTGQDAQFRWTATQSSRSDTTLEAIYDYTGRSMPTFVFSRRALDIDFQNHLRLGTRNDAVWGVAYHRSTDSAVGPVISLVRGSNIQNITSAFVQDEIQVSPRFRVTAGSKVQYDEATHLQVQPTLRLLFKASERQTFWAAATSAVRTPSEIELYGRVNVGAFPIGGGESGLIVLTGNPDLEPERVTVYEAGYRWQIAPKVALDATAYQNQMRDLITTATGTTPSLDAFGRPMIPVNFLNSKSGHVNGAELLVTDSVATNWNLAFGYSLLQSSASIGDASSPRHQVQLRSFIQLSPQFEVDSAAYYVAGLGNDIPSFVRLDAQLTWRSTKRWELSISAQNLLHSRHAEFFGTNGESQLETPVQRTVNGKVTWRF
jgi:iron complex outermembrane receptor protein